MNKTSKILPLALLTVFGASLLSSCNDKIDGARFLVTKCIMDATSTDDKETEDDRTDDIFTIELSITISVNNTQDLEIEVLSSEFSFSTPPVTYKMTDVVGNTKTSIVAGASTDGSTRVSWVKLESDFGQGFTYSEAQSLRNGLKLTYKGTDLNLPMAIVYK